MSATARSHVTPRPAAPPSSRCIVSPAADALLFWGTPLVIVPAVLLLHERFSSAQMYLFVASFGAVGHHLPGMLRAYGDRALFERFRMRFVLAPALLVATCVALAFQAKSALTLIVFAWGTWHGALQIHGFARIYDARAGSTRVVTSLLDQALAVAWFASVIALSDTRVHYLLDHALKAGLPAPPADVLASTRTAIVAVTLCLTIAWAAHALLSWRAGTPPSVLKIALLVSSIGFYAYANVAVGDLLLAVVLFEAFHDVQYLSIVWLYNRGRAASGPAAGAFTRWLFRPRLMMLLVYVGLCFAYGGLNWIQAKLPQEAVATALAGVLSASALLHFYYDGFIWKLRERGVREGLGMRGGAAERIRAPLWGPLAHASKWILLLFVPAGILAATAPRAPAETARVLALAAALPDDAGAQRNRAIALQRSGDLGGALQAARTASAMSSAADGATRDEIGRTLGALLVEALAAPRATPAGASVEDLVDEALATGTASADTLSDAAAARLDRGDPAGAERLCRALLRRRPDHGPAHVNLAVALASQGRLPEAHQHALRATRLMPGSAAASDVLVAIRAGLESAARQGSVAPGARP